MVAIGAEYLSHAQTAWARARQRWQAIGGSPLELIAHVEQLGARCGDLERFGDELHLACMCLRGDSVALRVLEAEYVARIPASLSRLGTEGDFVAEVIQLLRQRLLVLPEPRLASYAATGPLIAWLRVVAMRIALSLRRNQAPTSSELRAEDLIQAPFPEGSDALRYREAVDLAIRRGFGQLSLRERNLLRLHYLDGLSLDRLAGLHGAHRATVARWLADLKRGLMAEVEKDVRVQLKLSRSEFRSVLGLVRSHLDASLGALLGGAELAP